MQIEYARKFIKAYAKCSSKIKKAFNKRLKIFEHDQYNPVLNNHKLTGKYFGLKSINITGDWRAIFKQNKNLVIFMIIGTHSQLYK